jgi:hypothetical protein
VIVSPSCATWSVFTIASFVHVRHTSERASAMCRQHLLEPKKYWLLSASPPMEDKRHGQQQVLLSDLFSLAVPDMLKATHCTSPSTSLLVMSWLLSTSQSLTV